MDNESPKRPHTLLKIAYSFLYCVAVLFVIANFYSAKHPEYGYAWLPQFGAYFHERKTEEMKETRHLITSEYGYDGQMYAQLALDPLLLKEETEQAMDSAAVRARRILFSMTAYVFGMGDPDAIIQAYSFQNLIFWLLFAVIILHWFPPTSLQNAIRYIALLYTAGLMNSLTRSLLDGPALALIALGLVLIEKNRARIGNFVIGLAAVGKDTSIFSSIATKLPETKDARSLLNWVATMSLAAIPLAIWAIYLFGFILESASDTAGIRNFNAPMVSWWNSLMIFFEKFSDPNWPYSHLTFAYLISLPVQICFFLLRPQFRNGIWRLGAAYALFAMILGDAVWEGYVGAVPRVVLPMALAFNILVPKSNRWLPILILGNALTYIGWHDINNIRIPPSGEIKFAPSYQQYFDSSDFYKSMNQSIQFEDNWFPVETLKEDTWRWSSNNGTIGFENEANVVAQATLSFSLMSIHEQSVSIYVGEEIVGSYKCPVGLSPDYVAIFPLQPGLNTIKFIADRPAAKIDSDPRNLSFALRNYKLHIE